MPDNTVVALKGVIHTSSKAAWLDQVAQQYDSFVEETGEEPGALICVIQTPGRVKSSWNFESDLFAKSNPAGALLIAAEHLRRQAWVDDGS